ncbi:MAG: hypothetical protein JXP48_10985 [Acidobacteria bacterium]|nr:hypothetical protein [Acidobacteriota bacterium]
MKPLPAAFLLCLCAASPAQQSVDIRPGSIKQIEGEVYLGDARLPSRPARPLVAGEGELLRTGEGKVEVQLGLYATLWMGARSSLCLEDPDYDHMSLTLLGGSAIVEIIEGGPGAKLTVHLGPAAVEFRDAGVYRLDAGTGRVRVYDGKARVLLGEKSETLKRGHSADLAGGFRTAKFDRKRGDALQHWAAWRSDLLYDRIRDERLAERLRRQAESARQQAQIEAEARSRIYLEQSLRQEEQQMRLIEQQLQGQTR